MPSVLNKSFVTTLSVVRQNVVAPNSEVWTRRERGKQSSSSSSKVFTFNRLGG